MKKAIFSAYAAYVRHCPVERGKHFLGQLLSRTLGHAIYMVDGVKLELNPAGWLDRELMCGKAHNPIVSEVIAHSLKDGGTFVDVGANIGYFSLLAARMKGVRVLAFEPSPRELARLHRNVALNRASNVTVLPYGLADVDGVFWLNLAGDSNPGMNSLVDLSEFASCVERVPCTCVRIGSVLSESVLRDVRVCKIDVEGAEVGVLQGMAAVMPLMTKAVFAVEVSPLYLARAGFSPRHIYDFFAQWGYTPRFGPSQQGHYDDVFVRTEL